MKGDAEARARRACEALRDLKAADESLTVVTIAGDLGFSRISVLRWLNGQQLPRGPYLDRLEAYVKAAKK